MSKMTMSEAGRLGFLKSQATQRAQKEKRIQEYFLDPNKCQFCEAVIDYENRVNSFCNRSCAASFNNCGKTKNYVDGKYSIKKCCWCNKETDNTKFCSMECRSAQAWHDRCKEIETQGRLLPISSGYGYDPHSSKKYLMEKRGHKCEICLNEYWQNQKIPLVLDHISGDPTDHSLTNVRLVCGNCNMQLPTFAGKNKGKGRKNRKEVFGA